MNNLPQLSAADPKTSVWVSASAGTGKTKVLTDRVLRLLLDGVSHEKILCLTFTNTAADEMLCRINKSIEKWFTSDIDTTIKDLEKLLGSPPNVQHITRARGLFSVLFNNSNQIKIQTIHSFCQAILTKFPIEANISPNFKIMDNLVAPQIVCNIVKELLTNSDAIISETIQFFISNFHEYTIKDLVYEIIACKYKFQNLLSQYTSIENYISIIIPKININDIILNFLKTLKRYTFIFNKELENYVCLPIEEQINKFDILIKIFLTEKGEPRQKIYTKKFSEEHPEFVLILEQIQKELIKIVEEIKNFKTILFTMHLLGLAIHVIDKYEFYKNLHNYLDFNDLIYITQHLFSQNAAKEVGLYKLDGGIEHLLVDEAQDTSSEQWKIIKILISNLCSNNNERNKTIFVVGDDKQSIYSFQGANLLSFYEAQKNLADNMHNVSRAYKMIDLIYCYRSTKAILDFVYSLFDHIQQNISWAFENKNTKLISNRPEDPGRVEIWPIFTNPKEKKIFWPIVSDQELDIVSARKAMAQKIAQYISDLLKKNIILPSTQKCITCNDIMILVRKRDDFTLELIKQIKFYKIKVAGLDRINLKENISVLDIMSIAKFIITPWDDLNLAGLLKSPFIGISEEYLYKLSINRTSSIWQKLHEYDVEMYDKLIGFKLLYSKSKNLFDFFYTLLEVSDYRKCLLNFNGEDSEDIIDEFLRIVQYFVDTIGNSLHEFITWFEQNDLEITRNLKNITGIKIMTIHSAKGLESNVVILADNTNIPASVDELLWKENMILWPGRLVNASKQYKKIREEYKLHQLQEYFRLLYVALTRARDYLVICAYTSQTNIIDEYCWYSIIKNTAKFFFVEEDFFSEKEKALVYQLGEFKCS